ncbi:hypothetical protein O7599_11735 [Streptomyces sp. WMMC500]|uniref:hypothetical protein n=1 Tax=Streptomyces sp. WMMC500 TaxID=3015154 RepID=UPI00248C46C8|nr:hypothetical protein [Streptomyces sp. WMMC500]WBB64797.1 hypothetical protein O7599_11735 [Streptomyces sp. WMMC500]
MKDILIGILIGLFFLVVGGAVFWLLASSSDADREECERQAERSHGRVTCIVTVE